jgi:hypothetical protein
MVSLSLPQQSPPQKSGNQNATTRLAAANHNMRRDGGRPDAP